MYRIILLFQEVDVISSCLCVCMLCMYAHSVWKITIGEESNIWYIYNNSSIQPISFQVNWFTCAAVICVYLCNKENEVFQNHSIKLISIIRITLFSSLWYRIKINMTELYMANKFSFIISLSMNDITYIWAQIYIYMLVIKVIRKVSDTCHFNHKTKICLALQQGRLCPKITEFTWCNSDCSQ